MSHDQPFYSVLPDEHDCTRLFRGVRTSKYVAQVFLPPPLPHPSQVKCMTSKEHAEAKECKGICLVQYSASQYNTQGWDCTIDIQ